jgi:hypothetical protein
MNFLWYVFVAGLAARHVLGEQIKEKDVPTPVSTAVVDACREDKMCSAKRIIDRQTHNSIVAAEIEATFSSHGVSSKTLDLLVDECDVDALVSLITDLYPSCVDPVDVIDRRSSSYHVVAVSVFLVVLTGIYIALFVVWTFTYRSKDKKIN